MQNFEQTIISQYANSPVLVQLVENMNAYIDPHADLDAFYSFVWDVETAQGFGLDIWGKIVNVSRHFKIPGEIDNFGFNAGNSDYKPFGQAPFYNGAPKSAVYALGDDAFRTLILVKALSNISNCSVPAFNQLLSNLFKTRGRCYVQNVEQMKMRFVFEFALLPFEQAIMTSNSVIPRPAGISAQILSVDLPTTFGFSEAKGYEPFGHGALFNSGYINVS